MLSTLSSPEVEQAEEPTNRPDIKAFRASDRGKAIVSWAHAEYARCKSAKMPKQSQWYTNMAMVFGQQWLQRAVGGVAAGKLKVAPAPRHVRRKTINRLRSFVRTETSKFLSQLPNIVAVPSTAEDEDVRAAYAGEQVWTSYASMKRFRREYSSAIWWMVLTGNGFIKTWWDPESEADTQHGKDAGDIAFRKITPFNIFVPEGREREVDDQPYIIEARVRPLTWAKTFYKEQLAGVKLSPTSSAANTVMDEGYLGLQNSATNLDSVVVYEFWVKPGATEHLPEGGFMVLIEDVLVDFYEGLPYTHGELPYTKIEHLFNDTFWADSPLVDLIPLQREYNEVRTDIGTAARRMGNPQLLAPQNSIVPGKMTNEPGAIIEYRPGLPQPGPMPLAQIPGYVAQQLDRVIQDFEDISGQHDISRGTAPAGISAGTALAYLGERDDNYLTPQYQGIEDGVERIAKHTLSLFQQFVDLPRKIKVVGLDGAFDTMLLEGADIAGGTDIRVEPGSALGQSQAAKQAQVMDLVSLGIIDGPTALKMLELGGPQKVLDIISAAERKAQRENMRMKAFKDDMTPIQEFESEYLDKAVQEIGSMGLEMGQAQQLLMEIQENLPPVVGVDDFDIHEMHIETHNRFRMSQEYETLPEEVKDQFEKHVAWHQQMGGAAMQQALMAQMPPELAAEGAGPGGGPEDMMGPPPPGMPPEGPQGAPPGAPPM